MKKYFLFLFGILMYTPIFADYSYQQGSICVGDVCSTEICQVYEQEPAEVSTSTQYPDSDMSSALYDYLVAQGEMRFADWLSTTVCISEEVYTETVTEIVTPDPVEICEWTTPICGDGIIQTDMGEECDPGIDTNCDRETCKRVIDISVWDPIVCGGNFHGSATVPDGDYENVDMYLNVLCPGSTTETLMHPILDQYGRYEASVEYDDNASERYFVGKGICQVTYGAYYKGYEAHDAMVETFVECTDQEDQEGQENQKNPETPQIQEDQEVSDTGENEEDGATILIQEDGETILVKEDAVEGIEMIFIENGETKVVQDGHTTILQEGDVVTLQDGSTVSLDNGEIILLQDGETTFLENGDEVLIQDGETVLVKEGETILVQDGEIILVNDGEKIELAQGGNIIVQKGEIILIQNGETVLIEVGGVIPVYGGEVVLVQDGNVLIIQEIAIVLLNDGGAHVQGGGDRIINNGPSSSASTFRGGNIMESSSYVGPLSSLHESGDVKIILSSGEIEDKIILDILERQKDFLLKDPSFYDRLLSNEGHQNAMPQGFYNNSLPQSLYRTGGFD